MWSSAPETDESDAIMEHQMRVYDSQIAECELATPVPYWDGFSGLVRVCDEGLAQALQRATQQQQQRVHGAAGADPGAPLANSPFATTDAESEVSAPDTDGVLLGACRHLLEAGQASGAAALLRTLLTSTPLHRTDVLQCAVELLLQAQGWDRERAAWPGAKLAGGYARELQAAMDCLKRSEPRRALGLLHKLRQSLPPGDGGCEADRLKLVRDFVHAKRHV